MAKKPAGSGRKYTARGQAKVVLGCSCGCGVEFQRLKSELNASGMHYVSMKHAGKHRTRNYMEDMCGPFLGTVTDYLNTLAAKEYKSLATTRTAVCHFALFLNDRGIMDLELVKPKTISQFLLWSEEVDYKNAAHDISVITSFFKWLIAYGYRRSNCPVISRWHGTKRPHYLPRPYSPEEMTFIWSLADSRGNSRLRAVIAIGEEAGLRLGEICRLRLEDVDLAGRRLFIRRPNKTDTEGWALFSDKSARYIAEWLLERDDNCGHQSLFHNTIGGPLMPETLHHECARSFCRTHGGKELHSVGVDQWSTHRLRHTMASNLARGGASIPTIMSAGRWKSVSSMMIYTKNDEVKARRDYDEAMRRAYEQAENPTSVSILTVDEFLSRYER
jgi:site-specific recombinase XerD